MSDRRLRVPKGMFAPGGVTPRAPNLVSRPIVPLEWLKCHPSTFPWWGKAIRANVGAPFIIDTLLDLDTGYAGVVTHVKLLGHSNIQGANGGINWQLLVNRIPVIRARRLFGGSNDEGFVDDIGGDDAAGDTWRELVIWLEEGALLQVRYNNNGGPLDAMGAICQGYAYPVAVYEEWVARGWRATPQVAVSSMTREELRANE